MTIDEKLVELRNTYVNQLAAAESHQKMYAAHPNRHSLEAADHHRRMLKLVESELQRVKPCDEGLTSLGTPCSTKISKIKTHYAS